MKYLSIALVLLSLVLAAVLFQTKKTDTAQLAAATGTLADCSNRLDTAQAQIAACNASLLTLSNTLAETALADSNHLAEAQAQLAAQTAQLAGLNRELAAAMAANQSASQTLLNLTNQMTALTQSLAKTEAGLTQTNQLWQQACKDYAQLENKFLRDVAERTLAERRFNNLVEVQAQEKKLMKSGAAWVTPESIYAGLNVEVRSNGTVHVLAPE